MKFIINRSGLRIVGAGTDVTLFDNRNLFICDDEIYNKQVFSEDSVYCIFDYF